MATPPELPQQEPHLTLHQKQENRIVQRVLQILRQGQDQSKKTDDVVAVVSQEQLTRFVHFMTTAKVRGASALLAAALGALYAYLTLAGVTDMSPARVVLIGLGLFLWLFAWELISETKWRRSLQWKALLAAALLIVLLAFGLDHWTVKWRIAHPPEIGVIKDEIHNLTTTVEQITQKPKDAPKVTTSSPAIKFVNPIPGYLKLRFEYEFLPPEEVGKSVEMNVYYDNRGSTYVHDATMKSRFVYVDFHGFRPPNITTPELQQKLVDELNGMTLQMSPSDIGPGDSLWNTLSTSVLTQNMVDNLNGGTSRIYYIGRADWSTGGIADHAQTCVWLQPASWQSELDPHKLHPVWHGC